MTGLDVGFQELALDDDAAAADPALAQWILDDTQVAGTPKVGYFECVQWSAFAHAAACAR